MYAHGWGVPRDTADAIRWFEMANSVDSDGPPTDWMSVEGYGVEKDPEQAAFWYKQAANSGHPEAQFFLALLYSSGKGVKRDEEQAERWVSSSATQGYASAMAELGKRFANGTGVAKDDKRAYFWLTLAFLHGDKSEEKLRTAEAAKLAPADVTQEEHAAQNWKPRIASAKPRAVRLSPVGFLFFGLTAAMASGQAVRDPNAVLEQVRTRLRAMAQNLEKYVCIETINRSYYQRVAPRNAPATPRPSLACAPAVPDDPFRLASTDRVRLDVTVSQGAELHSWPGATRFDARDVDDLIRNGPVSTGSFGRLYEQRLRTAGRSLSIQGRADRRRQNAPRIRLSRAARRQPFRGEDRDRLEARRRTRDRSASIRKRTNSYC